MNWQWEEFRHGPDTRDELRVTLSPKGEIMIGARAVERLGRADWAVLSFDRRNSLIGVRPAHRHVENAYPLLHKLKGRHRIIRAFKFCLYYGIAFERTRAFVKPQIQENGMLVLDLKATVAAGKRLDVKRNWEKEIIRNS